MFPFDLRGPQFLLFYVVLLLIGFLATYALRRWLLRPGDEGEPADRDLDPYSVAVLSGGSAAAATTVIAHLVDRGFLTYEPTTQQLAQGPRDGPGRPWNPFERDVYDQLSDGSLTLSTVHAQARRTAEEFFTEDLRERGLLLSKNQRSQLRVSALFIMGPILLVGYAKCFDGMGEQRHVGFLMLLLVNLVLPLTFFASRGAMRTRRGDRVLEALRRKNPVLATTTRAGGDRVLQEKDLLMIMGLYSLAAVSLLAIAELKTPLANLSQTQSANSTSSSNSAGCDAGDGGGGGGCGGCGG